MKPNNNVENITSNNYNRNKKPANNKSEVYFEKKEKTQETTTTPAPQLKDNTKEEKDNTAQPQVKETPAPIANKTEELKHEQ